MENRFMAMIFFAALMCSAFASAQELPDSRKIPGMGHVHYIFDLGNYDPESTQNHDNLPKEQMAQAPVALYHLNPGKVANQLHNMRASGMDSVVIQLIFKDMSYCSDAGTCYSTCDNPSAPTQCDSRFNHVWGAQIDSQSGALPAQQRQNLLDILKIVHEDGFRVVFIRFSNWDLMRDWCVISTWQQNGTCAFPESRYQKAWNFIADTHRTVSSYLENNKSDTRAIYDLGLENMGSSFDVYNYQSLATQSPIKISTQSLQPYVTRLWIDYISTFGRADTVGFSTISHLSTVDFVTPITTWYGGYFPEMYAFDVYMNGNEKRAENGLVCWRIDQGLKSALNRLPASEKTKPIMIMETFQDPSYLPRLPGCPSSAQQIASLLEEIPSLDIRALMQWPAFRDPQCENGTISSEPETVGSPLRCNPHFRRAAIDSLNFPGQLESFKSIAAKLTVNDSSTSLLTADDIDCRTTISSTCSVKLHFGYVAGDLPYYRIFARTNNGRPNYVACTSAASNVVIPWIQRNKLYSFSYFKTASCRPALLTPPPS